MNRFDNGDPNIWNDVERPELRKLQLAGKVTTAIVVDYDTKKMWELDLESQKRGKEVKSIKSHNVDLMDINCANSGVGAEPEDLDIFGGFFSDIPEHYKS